MTKPDSRKIKTTVTLITEYVDWVYNELLPSNPEQFQFHVTRAISDTCALCLGLLNGQIPEIPPRRLARTVERVAVTLPPPILAQIDAIVGFYRSRKIRFSRSDVINHFLDSRMKAMPTGGNGARINQDGQTDSCPGTLPGKAGGGPQEAAGLVFGMVDKGRRWACLA